jgi:hypothetical protein
VEHFQAAWHNNRHALVEDMFHTGIAAGGITNMKRWVEACQEMHRDIERAATAPEADVANAAAPRALLAIAGQTALPVVRG